ncbi:MAG: TIGR02186 family protein [Devosia sp.]|nr:TIGR02186 family protein [Devosia sp.]
MRALAALVLLAAALLAATPPALAEKLVSTVSNDEVSITSSFAGEKLTLFGNIEPEAGAPQRYVEGPFQVIIVVTGPLQDRIARLKRPRFGIWMNTEQVVFDNFPSFYHVLASDKLSDITDEETLGRLNLMPESQARITATPSTADEELFGRELVRLMTEQGYFGVKEQGVVFRSSTFYSGQVSLPSDVPPGSYLAHTYVFKNGELITERSEGFAVRKIGFERFLALAAQQQPLLYGLVCVILAVFTGWLGGVVFKR